MEVARTANFEFRKLLEQATPKVGKFLEHALALKFSIVLKFRTLKYPQQAAVSPRWVQYATN
eukprot:13139725-Alexandrium_andersonii.AAC.1